MNRNAKVGDKQVFYYKGRVEWEYEIKGIARLPKQKRQVFDPQIVLLESTTDAHPPLKKGDRDIRFPYWVKAGDTWRFGQFAPLFGEDVLLELLTDAIKQGFFSNAFLKRLGNESLRSAKK